MSDSRAGPADGERREDAPDRGTVLAQLSATDLSRHPALFYQSREAQLTTVSAYVADGIHRDECCLYIADHNETGAVESRLAADGLDVDALTDSGQLRVVDSQSVYDDETFDPEESVDSFETFAREAVDDGYAGLRAAGENTWSFQIEGSFDTIVEFEMEFDRRCSEMPVTALCQYSLDQFGDAEIGHALQAHEQIIYDNTVAENPYYSASASCDGPESHRSNVELLLQQTRDIVEFKRDVEAREQRLSVVNRVLRHNLRNELNVVLGRAGWLQREGLVDAAGREHLDTIETVAERLVDLSEHARHVERTLEGLRHEAKPVVDVVADAVVQAEREVPHSLAVTLDVSDDVAVDSAVGTALEHLFTAVGAAYDETVPVAVDSDPGDSLVVVSVGRSDRVVPVDSQQAISGRVEDALQHGLGLRLWTVRWIVEAVDGTLSIEPDGEGERVVCAVPVVCTNAPAG